MQKYFNKTTSTAPLAVFRICFGLLMLVSLLRFWLNGWIDMLYIKPSFFFSYYGLEWIKPLGSYTYLLFVICIISTVGVILGYKYRLSMIVFFLSFTYIEFMDKTTYLNHYYFISSLSFLLIFLPMNRYFSVDVYRNPHRCRDKVPAWTIDSIKVFIGLVYIHAGLMKINSDWLLHAMPLKIWLSTKHELPIIGWLFQDGVWPYYAFSWGGMLYDISIPFLLMYKRTRLFGFVCVVGFHVMTKIFFPIGMFPYIMIVSALIFFGPKLHQKVIDVLQKILRLRPVISLPRRFVKCRCKRFVYCVLVAFFLFQILMPWRHLLYPGELFWREEGFRFSWRVMLMEKAGYAQFKIVDKDTGNFFYVDNSAFLTPFQEKQMATQPDFILQYAHFLGNHYKQKGCRNIAVFVESYVALNGRSSTLYINPNVDLLTQKDSFAPKTFILPFKDDIKGL